MEKELEVAIAAARAAGAAIREIMEGDAWEAVEKADGKGPVTEADLASNDILIRIISEAFPDDAILSEETADDGKRLGQSRCWIIDPLDGTREFTLRIPEYCVSVGFVVDNVAVVGALYNPATGELIAGGQGLGVRFEGESVSVSEHAALEGARFLVSRSEHKKGWFDAYKSTVNLQPMGSVAWKFGLVAAGRAEATFTPKPRNAWDLCAGVACIESAGGRCSNKHGARYRFNVDNPLKDGVCGSNGEVHDAVLELMTHLG